MARASSRYSLPIWWPSPLLSHSFLRSSPLAPPGASPWATWRTYSWPSAPEGCRLWCPRIATLAGVVFTPLRSWSLAKVCGRTSGSLALFQKFCHLYQEKRGRLSFVVCAFLKTFFRGMSPWLGRELVCYLQVNECHQHSVWSCRFHDNYWFSQFLSYHFHISLFPLKPCQAMLAELQKANGSLSK